MSDPFQKVVYHLPLERYQERYTQWLIDVEQAGFAEAGLKIVEIEPSEERSINVIKNGRVLDSMQRSFYSLEQVRCLLMQLENDVHKSPLTRKAVYLSDMFTPGIEALFYNEQFRDIPVFAFCWAQTVDVWDFTFEQHLDWMRNYEKMVLPRLNTVFVASSELLDRCIVAFPEHKDKFTCVGGLPFSVSEVYKIANVQAHPVREKLYHVVYSSRFDAEKNPGLFLDIVDKLPGWVKVVICTGAPELRGDKTQVERARMMQKTRRNFTIFEDLSKEEYYTILRQSTIQLNCFSGDTLVLTPSGSKPIRELVGKTTLMTEKGKWTEAVVKSFGKQEIVKLRIGRGSNSSFTIKTTAGHRWILVNGREVTTDKLQHGDNLAQVAKDSVITDNDDYIRGVQHGIIFGDGSVHNKKGFCVRLCGKKKELLSYFKDYSHSYPPSCKGDPVVYMKGSAIWADLKSLPDNFSESYLLGFFRGWLATDGSVSSSAHNYSLSGQCENIEWARRCSSIIGWHPAGVQKAPDTVTPYGKVTNQATLVFYSDTLRDSDIILRSAAEKIQRIPKRSRNYVVKSVEHTGIFEEVFCAEVPDTQTFCLWNGLLTGNCALQDWVSFTLLEALSFGCVPVYPMYRSFPEALDYDDTFMYKFRSAESAVQKIMRILEETAEGGNFHQGETLKRSENVMTLIAEHMRKELE